MAALLVFESPLDVSMNGALEGAILKAALEVLVMSCALKRLHGGQLRPGSADRSRVG